MSATTLLVAAALDATTFVVFLAVALRVLRRLPLQRGHATEAFALFWFAVAVVNLLNSILEVWSALGDPGLAGAFALWNTRIAVVLAGFAGLVHYLVYLYFGDPRLKWIVGAFYITTFWVMQVWLIMSDPVGPDIRAWWVGLETTQTAPPALFRAVVVLFFLPPFLATFAYAGAIRHLDGADQRRRASCIAVALAAYFVLLLVGYMNLDWRWWGLVENLSGIAVGAIAFFALGGSRPTPA